MGRAVVVLGLMTVALWAMATANSSSNSALPTSLPFEEYVETPAPLILRRLESAEISRRRFRPRPGGDNQTPPVPAPALAPASALVPAPAGAPAPPLPSRGSPSIAPAGRTAPTPPAGSASSAGSSRDFSLGCFFCTLFILLSSFRII